MRADGMLISSHISTKWENSSIYKKYMATMSLSDLREFFTAKDEELLEIIQKNGHNYCHDFLTEALEMEPYDQIWDTPEYQEHVRVFMSGVKVQFNGDAISQPNEA